MARAGIEAITSLGAIAQFNALTVSCANINTSVLVSKMAIALGTWVEWNSKAGLVRGKVTSVVTDGKVPDIAIELEGTEDEPGIQCEVYRLNGDRWEASNLFVGKLTTDLVKIEPLESDGSEPEADSTDSVAAVEVEDLFRQGEADGVGDGGAIAYAAPATTTGVTDEQLKKINRFTPANMEPLQAHEVVAITFIASDNLLNRGLGKWREKDLLTLAKLSPGLPLTLDHDWEEVSKVQGLIFDSRILKYDSAPKNVLEMAGNLAWNRKVVAKEGFIQHELDVAFPSNSQALHGLRFGLLNSVSLGGFNYRDHVCPLCDTSFDNDACPHGIPMPMYGLTSEVDNRIAPYYIRDGVFDLGECSLVSIPNLPLAGVKRRGTSVL